MFLGLKIINMDSLNEYKLTEFNSMGVRRDKIELSLNNGKNINVFRDPENVKTFEKYLKEKSVAKVLDC